MNRAFGFLTLAALLIAAPAGAGNKDEVNAGVDVTLTGGAVGAEPGSMRVGIAHVGKWTVAFLKGLTLRKRGQSPF